MRALLLIAALLLACGASGTDVAAYPRINANKPVTAEHLADYVSRMLEKSKGVGKVVLEPDGRLSVHMDSGRVFSIGLANLLDAVNSSPPKERKAHIEQHIAVLLSTFAAKPPVPGSNAPSAKEFKTNILPVVKNLAYLDQVRSQIAETSSEGSPQPRMLSKPLAGELVAMVALDLGNRMMMMQEGGGKSYGMSDQDLEKTAHDNFLRLISKLAVVPEGDLVRVAFDENYTASLLTMPELWAQLSKQFKGPLLVAVPSRDVVVFTDKETPEALTALRKIAEEPGRPYPLTTDVLRWTEGKWSVVKK